MDEKIKNLAKGKSGRNLIEVLEEVKAKVADIRTPIKIRAEIQNEVRMAVIECLDLFLIEKLKIMSGSVNPQDPNEYN